MKVLNALFFLLSLSLAAQQTGSVRVSVTDPSGAIITQASLLLTSSSTGYQQSVVCGPTGNCEFANVPFGRYSLRAEAAGFKQSSRDLAISSTLPLTVIIPLSVAASRELVAVSGKPGEEQGNM